MGAGTHLAASTADWLEAISTCVTAVVALFAVCVAYVQAQEARSLRIQQAAPYVAVFLEPTEVGRAVEIVVRNFGTTTARDVVVTTEPALESALRRSTTAEGQERPILPESIDTLVPGQEWRTLLDTFPGRRESGLPDVYRLRATYRDADNVAQAPYLGTLDWELLGRRATVEQHGLHELVKATRAVERRLGDWSQHAQALHVVVDDAGPRLERRRLSGLTGMVRRAGRRLETGVRRSVGLPSLDAPWWPVDQRLEQRRVRVAKHRAGRWLIARLQRRSGV